MFRIISKVLLASAAVTTLALSLAAPAVGATASTATTTTNQACVDGTVRANFAVTWIATDNVSVKTVNNKLLCADVTVFFSSYVLPDNYNGQGFVGNPTASPQTHFDSTSAVLKKGTNGATNLKIKIPEACKGMQVDLYYAPQITTVTSKGHGNQYISGKILSKTQETCTPVTPEEPPVIPEVPVPEAETPPTQPPVVVVPVETPVELPHTGTSFSTPLIASAIVSVAGYAAAYAFSKRR